MTISTLRILKVSKQNLGQQTVTLSYLGQFLDRILK
jgi:hypothetical protein